MPNPNGNAASLKPRLGPRPIETPLKEARALQRILFRDANDPDCKPSVRALLARSWCMLQDTIRVMRGIPSPGQLRPDLDPVQMAKAWKRAKLRQPIDVLRLNDSNDKFYDEPEPEKEPTKSQTKKESLSPSQGVTAERGGEGEKVGEGDYKS